MPDTVGFHFIMLAAGEVLKYKSFVSAQDIQDFIRKDEAFGVRVPLSECRLALQLLLNSGFILQTEQDTSKYILA